MPTHVPGTQWVDGPGSWLDSPSPALRLAWAPSLGGVLGWSDTTQLLASVRRLNGKQLWSLKKEVDSIPPSPHRWQGSQDSGPGKTCLEGPCGSPNLSQPAPASQQSVLDAKIMASPECPGL